MSYHCETCKDTGEVDEDHGQGAVERLGCPMCYGQGPLHARIAKLENRLILADDSRAIERYCSCGEVMDLSDMWADRETLSERAKNAETNRSVAEGILAVAESGWKACVSALNQVIGTPPGDISDGWDMPGEVVEYVDALRTENEAGRNVVLAVRAWGQVHAGDHDALTEARMIIWATMREYKKATGDE